MNFDTSVRQTNITNRFEVVGNVYQDDAEKLHSDLIGINAIDIIAMKAASASVAAATSNHDAVSPQLELKVQH